MSDRPQNLQPHDTPVAATTTCEAALLGQGHSILAALVKAADLVDTLASPGPFTVFAPTDAAFAKLPAGTVDQLLQPENRRKLDAFATYHILAGRLTTSELRERARANHGHLTLRTVEGDMIEVEDSGERLEIVDTCGTHAAVTTSDLQQSNGVIHVMDSVLSPRAW